MTRKEKAMGQLKFMLEQMPEEPPSECDYIEEWFDTDREIRSAFKMAIEALEQEPCDDTISRKAAIDAIIKIEQDDIEQYGCKIPEGFDSSPAIEALNDLPPAIPQPKIGHWVNKSRRSGCGILFVASECTCCGMKTPFNCDEFLYRYCPNCGAKMVELQESEEGMTDEQTKQAILGFTEFFKGVTGNQNLEIPSEIAEKFGIQPQAESKAKEITNDSLRYN